MSLHVPEKPKRSCFAQPGNTMMEYGIVAALIILIALPGLYLAGGQLRQWTDGLKDNLNSQRDTALAVSQQALTNSRAMPRQVGYAYTLSSGGSYSGNHIPIDNDRDNSSGISDNREIYGNTTNTLIPAEVTGTGGIRQDPEATRTSTNRQKPKKQRPSNPKKTAQNPLGTHETGKGGTNDTFVPSKEIPTVAGTMGRPLGNDSGPKEPPQTAGAAGHPKIEETVKKFIEPIHEFVTTITGGKPKQDKKKNDNNSSNKNKTTSQPQGITTVVVGTMGVKQGQSSSETTKSKTKTQTNKQTLNNGKTGGSSASIRLVAPTQVAGTAARVAYNPKSSSTAASSQPAGNKKKTNTKSGK